MCRSAACMRLGRAKEALEDAERAIACDEAYAKGYLRRGVAYMALKEWESALRDFEKV
jgi:tetratricopeptide (TPR) repeat protein